MSNREYSAKIDFQSKLLKKDDFLFKYFYCQTEQKKLHEALITLSVSKINEDILNQGNQ